MLFQIKIKSHIKAARIEAPQAYHQYVEEPNTSPQRERLDVASELLVAETLTGAWTYPGSC